MKNTPPLEINATNLDWALASIAGMVQRRGLAFELPVPSLLPTFESKHQKRKFRNRMYRVIHHPTMRSANTFLRYLGEGRVTYTAKEQLIRDRRKKFTDLRREMLKAKAEYLAEKGDFYGGKVREKMPVSKAA